MTRTTLSKAALVLALSACGSNAGLRDGGTGGHAGMTGAGGQGGGGGAAGGAGTAGAAGSAGTTGIAGTAGVAGMPGAAGTTGTAGSGSAGVVGSGGGSGAGGAGGDCPGAVWAVSRTGNLVSLNFGSGASYPQFGVIDVTSGYARFVYGPSGGWGPSVILPPSFWSGQVLYQSAPVAVSWSIVCDSLHVDFTGTLGGLSFAGTLDVDPPGVDRLVARVAVTTTGTVPIDVRPGEAFKTAMISTMNESDTSWDSMSALVGGQSIIFPQAGWVVSSPIVTDQFGVVGGTSSWKSNAPSVGIALGNWPAEVTGWVTASSDPNDDNVLLWAASDDVQSTWSYQITVASAP